MGGGLAVRGKKGVHGLTTKIGFGVEGRGRIDRTFVENLSDTAQESKRALLGLCRGGGNETRPQRAIKTKDLIRLQAAESATLEPNPFLANLMNKDTTLFSPEYARCLARSTC